MPEMTPRDTMIARWLFVRDRARAIGDRGVEREALSALYKYGWRPDATPAELEQVEQRAEAEAVPVRRPATTQRSGLGPVSARSPR